MMNVHLKGNQVCSQESVALESENIYASKERKEIMIRQQDVADISCGFQLNPRIRFQEIRKKEFNVKIRCTEISCCFRNQTSDMHLRKLKIKVSRQDQDVVGQKRFHSNKLFII